MKVIKLGGSLLSDKVILEQCLNHIATANENGQTLVIVPGGGVFADLVRTTQQQWNFSDKTAHSMAILAMQQMAWLLQDLNPAFLLASTLADIKRISLNRCVVIWSPSLDELSTFSIDENWDVTSDSLAAWLASQINANELVLVKSTNIPKKMDLIRMQKQGIVDKAFGQFTQSPRYKISILNRMSFVEYSLFD